MLAFMQDDADQAWSIIDRIASSDAREAAAQRDYDNTTS